MKKRLGLDLGVASVGWALIEQDDEENPIRIIDEGSFCYSELEKGKDGKLDNVTRREKRGARRQRRRKVYRLKKTRKLFIDFNLISKDEDFFKIVKDNKEDILSLKVKGLEQKLSKDELMLVLYHYMKFRGFKSTREVEDKENDKKEGLLDKIYDTSEKLKKENKTISKYLYDELNKLDYKDKRYHNHDKEYKLTVARGEYLNEIKLLLDNQIKLNVVNEDFKIKYIGIYNSQRNFSEGPDGRYSVFGVDRNKGFTLIDKMRGKCIFDNQARAPKNSFSAKSFVLLSSLVNLRFKYDDENSYIESSDNKEYKKLNVEGINKIYNKFILEKEIKYSKIIKELNLNPEKIIIKGLYFSKKQDKDFYKDFVNKNNKLINKKFVDWDAEIKEKFKIQKVNKILDKKIIYIDEISPKIKKVIDDSYTIEKIGNLIDLAVECLFKFKTDESLKKELEKNNVNEEIINTILELKSCSGTIDLSLEMCKKIIPLLKEGFTYDKALQKLNIDHSSRNKRNVVDSGEINDFIPEINDALKGINKNLTNPVVKNTLSKMIKVINAVVKKYGKIDSFAIEFSREIKKNFEDRKKIMFEQIDNMNGNNSLKMEILDKYSNLFPSFYSIKKDDLIKYKLFKEQNGISPYTGKRIIESSLFDNGNYEVDHIIPYSRCFDDSFNNKVLVEREENQNKKNRTPLEYFKDIQRNTNILKEFVNQGDISTIKEENLLKENIELSFNAQDLNSTAYIARLAKELISYYLMTDENGNVIDDSNFLVINGAITDILKRNYGLKGRTHSFAAGKNYKNQKEEIIKSCIFKGKELSFEYLFFDKTKSQKPISKGIFAYSIKDKNQKESEMNKEENDLINLFARNIDIFNNLFEGKNINNNELIETIESIDLDNEVKTCFLYFVQNNITKCQLEINKKDRDNDLHHALDACIIATVNRKTIYCLSNYYKNNEINGNESIQVPLPYKDFREEVLLKTYERNLNILKDSLLKLSNYSNYKNDPKILSEIHVLYPTRLPYKIKASSVSAETIIGKRQYKTNENPTFTKKVSVFKLKESDINNIVNANGGNDTIIKIIKEWFKNGDKKSYPILIKHTKDGKDVSNFIKTVKVDCGKKENDLVKLGESRYAENESFLCVRFYRNKENHKLYGCALTWYHLFNEKKNNEVIYKLMCGNGQNNTKYETKIMLNEEYEFICQCNRYSLVEILYGDKKTLCYTGGFTKGCFEVYSVLGDNYDSLICDGEGRVRLSINKIKDIKLKNISLLGYIN